MRFHIIGIGGAGMSAVAQLLLAGGHDVTGSDSSADWPLAKLVAQAGGTVVGNFDRRNVGGADVVIRSSAYKDSHPEVVAAREAGIPVWRRQDAWAFLARGKKVVAVAGTHGKTTTTGLVFSALRAGGLDPSLLCGGELVDLGANAYSGSGEHLVIEADEYDRAFLSLSPVVAVVTNVDHDHVDVFPNRADVEAAFHEFARRGQTHHGVAIRKPAAHVEPAVLAVRCLPLPNDLPSLIHLDQLAFFDLNGGVRPKWLEHDAFRLEHSLSY